jgi:ubiquinone/menaquinone biosynthesis C-methylase UbiE
VAAELNGNRHVENVSGDRMTASAPSYSFANADPEAVDRHRYLSEMLDELTFDQLSRLAPLLGRSCLEVGAGAGGVATWLADQVGPSGRVLATDLDTSRLPTDSGFAVLRHDLRTDPVPDGPWDVIHARLVLLHIPERREIVTRLAAALAPGGALILEEWASAHHGLVLAAPDTESAQLVEDYHHTMETKVLPARGNDPYWAEKVHGVLLDEGLVNVTTEIRARSWPGGTAGAVLIAANLAQLRDDFIAAGFAAERLDQLSALVHDHRLVLRGHFMYSTIAYRPGPSR